jgi:Holliday junction DNA helicase RuvB
MSKLNLEDLIGNEQLKTQLKISHGAAQLNNTPVPHILLAGLPGTGKTSTAKAAASLGSSLFLEAGPESFKTAESMAELFAKLPDDGYSPGGEIIGTINPAIIFIDEAHRLTLKSEEMLGIAMENWEHSFLHKEGKKSKVFNTWLPRFTLICATTKEGELSKPFRDRFKISYVFGAYSLSDSMKIIKMHAAKKEVEIDDQAVVRIAQRSRGTPRLMVRYLDRVIEAMLYSGESSVTMPIVEAQFQLLRIDSEGLTETDTIILKALYDQDSPVGLETLSLKTNQDEKTIKETSEPYLITKGFIERGKRGRIITEEGIKHLISLGVVNPKEEEQTLSSLLRRRL